MSTKRTRRERSQMTRADAVATIEKLAGRTQRMATSSSVGCFSDGVREVCEPGTLTFQILYAGEFADDLDVAEALRVLGGHKLPAKEVVK